MSPSSIQLSCPTYAKVTPSPPLIPLDSKNPIIKFLFPIEIIYTFSVYFFLVISYFVLLLHCNQFFINMLFKVAKHSKSNDPQRPQEPVIYVVEESELPHFLHENLKPSSGNVLVFDSFPEENLYLLSNDKD